MIGNPSSWSSKIYRSTFLIFLEPVPEKTTRAAYLARLVIAAPIIWLVIVPLSCLLAALVIVIMGTGYLSSNLLARLRR